MNKTELVEALKAETTDISKADISWVVSRLFKIVRDELENGGHFTIANFGSLHSKKFKGKLAYNFVIKELYQSKDRYKVVFKMTPELEERVQEYYEELNK